MSPISLPQVQVVRLGRMGYLAALQVQKYFQKQHLDQPSISSQTLLAVEHDPGLMHIYTTYNILAF